MLDWLRRDPRAIPTLAVGGRNVPVVIRRLDRARRMTMRIAPDGSEVRISIPRSGRTAEALAFARSRRDWVEDQIAALPVRQTLGSGATIRYRGELLTLVHDPTALREPASYGATLRVGGPAHAVGPRLQRWLRSQAQALLTDDLSDYCTRAGKTVPRLALSNARRRWGSCAADGTIRINWRLVMAPDDVRRSVVAHEVAHLIHFDHSPAFHTCLAELFDGDIAIANSWLKRNGRSLYHLFD